MPNDKAKAAREFVMSQRLALVQDALPVGWCARTHSQDVLIESGGGRKGVVTISFDERLFRWGAATIGPSAKASGEYRGRGWQKALVADAIKALQGMQ